ncbi:MAG: hypothetical protein ACE5G7_02555, partial [Candidatus Hydrothermarchaeaceae archaeon]
MYLVNPFSGEAKRLLRGFESTGGIPERVFQLTKERIEGEKDRRSRGKFHESPTPVDVKDDVLSTHLLLRSVGARYGYPSVESRTAVEFVKRLVRERIRSALDDAYTHKAKRYREDEVIMLFSDLLDPKPMASFGNGELSEDAKLYPTSREDKNILRYALPKERVLPLLRGVDRKLTDLYIFSGYVAANLNDMVDYYCECIGSKAIEVLSRDWQLDDPRAGELAELVAHLPSRIKKTYAPFIRGRRGREGRPLVMDHFPPCIRHTLEGVTTGSRNYAITVLLTSFLSYARVAPVGSSKDAKVSDYLKDISAVENEILPMIEEAARRCEPPLFEDQPMERMNVIYHLGFGLTNEPKLDDAGRSNWYFPPNCDKIQREAPSLCTPDAHCRTIKNPLSYYAKKLFPPKEKGKEEKGTKTKKTPRIVGEKLEGRIVEIQDGSGLIQRCPKCDRWIIDNFCIV